MDSSDRPRTTDQPLAEDEEQGSTLRAKAQLQEIVTDLARYGPSRSADDLRRRLEAAIAEAGLPEQPARWVEAVAIEAAAGRTTVLDARFASSETEESER
jgi:hypothetical protein